MEEILPHALLISGSNSQEIPWLGCDEISEPDLTLNSLGMTFLVSFESDGSNYQTIAVLNNAWELYCSSEHLYLIHGALDDGGMQSSLTRQQSGNWTGNLDILPMRGVG